MSVPVSTPFPLIILKTPSGKPASFNMSENTIALNGAISLGFSTIVQPAANAGATLHEI